MPLVAYCIDAALTLLCFEKYENVSLEGEAGVR